MDCVDVVVVSRLAKGRDGGKARGDNDRVPVVGTAVLTVAERHEPVHNVASSAENAERITAADSLAECAQVGSDSEILLRAADTHTEGAQHLIEHEHCSM